VIPVSDPLWISQNRTDVSQIIVNLILNARDTLLEKAAGLTEPGWIPTISIRFATVPANGHRLSSAAGQNGYDAGDSNLCRRVTVHDNGMGMSEEVRERIFEPFYTTKEVGQGTGLGLATVWHLIKTMGGRIDVETRLGAGSVFHVDLPAVSAPAQFEVKEEAEPMIASSERVARILVVDDQPDVAMSLSRILETWGHRVTTLEDGSSAISRLSASTDEFDVCITDLNMPGATGFDVIRLIRDSNLPIKVIAMGGYLTASVRQDLEKLKVDGIVPKPFSMADIAAAVRVSGW
jgi:CheY-like chemotaxis protein